MWFECKNKRCCDRVKLTGRVDSLDIVDCKTCKGSYEVIINAV